MSQSKKTLLRSLGGKKNIKSYVADKMARFESSDKSMRALYALMFSEEENVLAESTDGYRVKSVTYGESRRRTQEKAKKLAHALSDVQKGALVGIYLDNSLAFLECFWATLMAGYKPLLMNMRLSDGVINNVISDYRVQAVISEEKQFSARTLLLSSLNEGEEGEIDEGAFENEIYLMSSNTSGNLKICAYTGEEFFYQIKDSADIIKKSKAIKKHYNGRLKLLTFLPFYHIFGLVAVYIWFCFFSRTLVFLKDMHPKTILNTVKKHEVTHIFAVPLFWETVYNSALAEIKGRGEKTYRKFLKGMKLGDALSEPLKRKAFREVRENIFGESVLFCISGGGYLSKDAMRFLNTIGYPLVNGYGMTELGITSVELSEKAKERNLCSVGKPFTSLEYSINEAGELLVRGKSVSHKIYQNGECAASDENTWFNTHDLFRFEKGRYYIEGRKDDLIIGANGENFNPELLEPALYVEGVTRLCMLPSPASGKFVLLAEVNRGLNKQEMEGVKAALMQTLGKEGLSSSAEDVRLTLTPLIGADEFKVNRKGVLKRLNAGELKTVDFARVQEEIDEQDKELLAKITGHIASALNRAGEEIAPDAHFFFDLGGSSLDYFALLGALQEEFSLTLSVDANVYTAREFLKEIKRRGKL